MNPKLHRTFPSREHFAENFVRRLSDRGIEFKLTGQQAPPAGTVLQLDLRLEDGRPLIVGTGEVTSGGAGSGTFRLRFLELTEESRAGLDELILLAAATSDKTPATGTGTSIRDLVEGVYGEGTPTPSLENSAVLIPPEPRPAADRPPAGGRSPERRRSLLKRLQISPAVIVVAVIAGATGAAANAWFQDVAELFFEVSGSSQIGAASVIDSVPAGVAPSDFSAEPESADPGEGEAPGADSMMGGDPSADPAPEEQDAVPILSGSAGADGIDDPENLEAPARPADRIRVITWKEYASETVVTFFGNGDFLADRILHRRVPGGNPRELIMIQGIDVPFRETLITAQTPELTRIRTGFHPQDRINELHVVLDLAGPDVRLDRMVRDANSLRLHLRTVPAAEDAEATAE